MHRQVAVTLFLVAAAAHAQGARSVDGTIVRLDGDVAYVDVGHARGVRPGSPLHVLRTIQAKHPVTGETLTDHFPLGMMSLSEVGPVLSWGRIDRALVPLIKVGDVVRIGAPPPPPLASTEPARTVPGTGELQRVFDLTLGKPPGVRARILSEYLRAHPDSRYADAINREIVSFNAMESALQTAAQITEQKVVLKKRSQNLEVKGELPERLYTHDPFEVAVIVNHPERVVAALAYVRRAEVITYQRVVLQPDGDGYFRGRVPDELVTPPGVEVFVEVIDKQENIVSDGDEEHPRHVQVDAIPTALASPGPGHSAVRGFFEFVDWNRFRGNDYYLLTESDFTYRIGKIFYAVRTGFGIIYGKGGDKSDLDAVTCDPSATGQDPKALACGHAVGFNYGYVEGELHFGRYVGLAGRLLGGHTLSGPGLGAEMRLRIGNEMGTNLQIGGSILSDIGALGVVALEWDVIHGWPMSVGFSVTNQPNDGHDPGFRITYQIGYRAKSWLQPSLRIGYDARDINHAGLSLGAGLVMSW